MYTCLASSEWSSILKLHIISCSGTSDFSLQKQSCAIIRCNETCTHNKTYKMIYNKTILSSLFIALTVRANENDISHSNIFTEELSSEGAVASNGKYLVYKEGSTLHVKFLIHYFLKYSRRSTKSNGWMGCAFE